MLAYGVAPSASLAQLTLDAIGQEPLGDRTKPDGPIAHHRCVVQSLVAVGEQLMLRGEQSGMPCRRTAPVGPLGEFERPMSFALGQIRDCRQLPRLPLPSRAWALSVLVFPNMINDERGNVVRVRAVRLLGEVEDGEHELHRISRRPQASADLYPVN